MTFLRTPFYRTPPGHWLCRPRLEVIRVVSTITRKSKKYYYWKQILKYKDNIKKTWEVIKVIIGKAKMISGNFPEKVIINGKNNFVKKKFANKFNNFFVKVGPKLAKKVHRSKSSFESYIGSINFKLKEETVSRNELKKTLFSNTSPGINAISIMVIRHCFGELAAALKHIHCTKKKKFSIKDFCSKCDQIRRFLRIWSLLLQKSLMKNFIFCAVILIYPYHKVSFRIN